MESSIVIKVKYEDTLRRFNSRVVNEELELNVDGLREKIISLFKFSPETQFDLTYNDEDNDVVALVEDEELRDVVRQALNPLRITVSLNTAKSLNSSMHSSASSIPSFSPPTQENIQKLNSNVSEILKSLPEALCEPLSKLSSNLAKKATYRASNLAEITESLSKLGLHYMNQPPELPSTGESKKSVKAKLGLHYMNQPPELPSTGESKKSVEAYKDSDGIKSLIVPTEVTTGGSCEKPTSKTKKVLLKSKPIFKNDGVIFQGVSLTPGLKSSAASGSVSTNTSHPPNPVISSAHEASKDKQGIKETSEITGVKLFDAPPAENNCNSRYNWMDYSRRWWCPSDDSHATSADGWRKHKSASSSQYSLFPPVPSSSLNECPFTGMPIIDDTAIPHDAPSGMPETIYNYGNDIFDRGIRCDGCDVHPITGPRFKSKVREDYDLCSICFAEMGNDADFMRIDHPVVHRHPPSFKGSFRHKFKRHGVESNPLELDSRFILDVNILDGTIMPPLTHFTKIWRMRNSGTTVWPQVTRLDWIGGVRMTTSPSIELEITAAGVQVDCELDVAVDFVAPELHGRHISYWRMALPTGQRFGQRVWVLIEVNASLKKPMRAARPGFNLNFPPANESVTAPKLDVPISEPMMNQNLPENNMSNVSVETPDVLVPEPLVNQSLQRNMPNVYGEMVNVPIPDPTVDQRLPEPNMSNASLETIEPVNGQVRKEQEAKFPIDDSLLVGGIKYNAWHSGQSSSVSYPIIDLTEEIEPTVSAPSGMAILASDEVDADAQTEDEKLLKELEEMGFKHAALNKEVLKMNKNDLEQTIDDLCGGSEWDPILEELEEMGFYDRDMNKRLLRKNDGSIKRVVMDLIARE